MEKRRMVEVCHVLRYIPGRCGAAAGRSRSRLEITFRPASAALAAFRTAV
jgi:hypothetical protein